MSILPKELTRSVLQEAHDLITKDRQEEYGGVTESFEKIAKLASILTKKKLDKFDICWVMISVKLARETNKHKRDNLADLAGYVGLFNQLVEENKVEVEWPVPSKPFEQTTMEHYASNYEHNLQKPAPADEYVDDYESNLRKYLADRKLSQPQTGVMNDYKENAERVGWKNDK